MHGRLFYNLSLNRKLVLMMLFLSVILISILMFLYAQAERNLSREMERQTKELTKAIQIGVEEVTASGTTDEARLSKYLGDLNAKGLKEISIISNADEIVASTNLSKIGQPLPRKKKELIIKAELGEPVSEEEKTYNVIVPVVAGDTQYGYIHLRINKEDFSQAMRMNAIKRVVATLVVFGLGIGMILILSRHYTQPIKRVVDAAKRVAAGDLNQNLPVQSKDEIGQLSESFNFMVQSLRETRSLEERLREAEHLSGVGQLSRSMAHEIRNPLNFINLSIDYINEKYKPENGDTAQFDNLVVGMKQEIQRLNKLVNDYLDYSRPMRLTIQKVQLNDLLEEIMALIWAKAEADGITIKRELPQNPELDIDVDLFKSCVMNIIGNAFHAMEGIKGEKVLTIKAEVRGDECILAIADTGIGISQENLGKIFEPFFSTKQTGLGLGLPMAKRVLEEHRGRIEFTSIEGKGSEVMIVLPLYEKTFQKSRGA